MYRDNYRDDLESAPSPIVYRRSVHKNHLLSRAEITSWILDRAKTIERTLVYPNYDVIANPDDDVLVMLTCFMRVQTDKQRRFFSVSDNLNGPQSFVVEFSRGKC